MLDEGIIRMKLKEIFENQGTYINKNEYNEELVLDSLQLINIVIEIEEVFLLRITDDYLGFSELKTFRENNRYILCNNY